MNVVAIRTSGDNFIYVHPYGDGRAFAVDPGEAGSTLAALEKHRLTLTTILLTHHHWDHTGGAAELQSKTHCDVIGPDRGLIAAPDRTVSDGDMLTFGDISARTIATPGHTQACVCYYVEPAGDKRPGVVYTGDTLFVGGCGRPIECDAATLWESLCKLVELPDETLVYCGHDYTLENCEFALTIDPERPAFRKRLGEVQKAVEYGHLTVPSTMAQEKAANVFLLSDDPQIKAALGMHHADPANVFAQLRQRKNAFG